MDLKEVVCDGVEWIQVANDWAQWQAFVNTVINLGVPQKAEKFFAG
jgi:hypothetical protein